MPFQILSAEEYEKNAVPYPGTKVWRNPTNGKVYKGEIGDMRYEAQFLDITAIAAKVVMDEVLGLARPNYVLRNICRLVPMAKLGGEYPIATKLVADEKVKPLVEAQLTKMEFTTVPFALWKNVVHVALSDEEQMMASVNLMAQHVQDAGGALAASENSQIKTIAETATAIAGADWGNDANNPYDDIGAAQDVIEGAGYPADMIAAHPRAWGDFFSNDHVKGAAQGVKMPEDTSFPVPGLPRVSGFSDFALTNTIAIVLSSRGPGMVLGLGPTTAAKYRNEGAGYDAYIIRQWLEPKKVLAIAIRKLTGVHA